MCVSPTEFDVDVKRGSPPSLPLRRQRPKVLPHELGSVCEPVSPSHFSLCEKSSGPTLGGVEQHAPMKKRARPWFSLPRVEPVCILCPAMLASGTFEVDAGEDVTEVLFAKGYSDGLPLVAPTRERV